MMVKWLTAFLILCIYSIPTWSQVNKLNNEVSPLSSVERLDLPPLNNASLLKHYTKTSKTSPNRFAEAREVNISPDRNGTWETTKSDMMVWRQIIRSPLAHTINLGFTEYELPESAKLFIYNSSKEEILGPFSKADNEEHFQLWTPIIGGDEIVIELQVSEKEVKDVKLTLSKINHDFKNVRKSLQSGSCNLDVICGALDGWGMVDQYRDIISSVGAYSYNGTDQCSGVLINNARNDCRPFFLTAEHCGISTSNAPSIVVYWNYQNSYCRQPGTPDSGRDGDGSRANFSTGAVLRAELQSSDFSLIELDDPLDTSLDLYLAGWNIEKTLPDTSICIHHPGVEEKRISFEFNTLNYDPSGQDTTHILVNDWDIGTTEGGSSGSPIFNTRKQIIGQLTGGLAACGNNEYDSYGWMNWSWNGGRTLGSSLQPWLDPDNIGITELNGRSCNYGLTIPESIYKVCGLNQDQIEINILADGLFDDMVNYTFDGLPAGLMAEFLFDSGPVNEQNTLTISGFSNFSGPSFNIVIEVNDGMNSATTTIVVDFNEDIPMIPQGTSPINNQQGVSLSPRLNLKREQGDFYKFELASDGDFMNVLVSEETSTNFLDVSGLKEDTKYYWRANGLNLCGFSDWSPVYEFNTASVFCTTIHYEGDPLEIPSDSPGEVRSEINFPYGVMVESVTIPNVSGEHEYIEDLILELIYGNDSAILMSEVCGEHENFNLGFSDQSLLLAVPCPPVDGNLYKPDSPLSVFNSKFAGGSWELEIEDTAFLDGGQLNEWSMDVCFSNPSLSVIIPKDHRVYNCNENVVIEAYIFTEETTNWQVTLNDANHNSLDIDYSESSFHSNGRYISLLDKSQLQPGKNFLTMQLINGDNSKVLAFATFVLFIEDDIGVPEIMFPENGSKIAVDAFDNITWQSDYNGQYVTEIAKDSAFNEIIKTYSGINGNSILVEDEFEKGIYYLRIRLLSENCQSVSATTQFTIGMGTANNNLIDAGLIFYPNPVTDVLILKGELKNHDEIIVINLKGQTIFKSELDHNQSFFQVDLSYLDQGLYIAIVKKGNRFFRQKLIKI